MSGHASIAFEQTQPVDVVKFSQETPDISAADPIASFLEKHGTIMMQNHEGQMVTVDEAMANCPPFARLVEAMGEGALSLTATQRPEEETAEKEDQTGQMQEGKKPEKNSDNGQPENYIAPKQEAQKVEQSQTTEVREQKIVTTSEITTKSELADNAQPSGGTSQSSTAEVTNPENATQTATQKSQPAESPALAEALTPNIGSAPFIQSRNFSPVNVVVAEASPMPPVSMETKNRLVIDAEALEPTEVNVTATREIEELSIWLDEIPRIDVEVEADDELPGRNDLTLQLSTDELGQPTKELIEQGLSEEQTGEDFILPLPEDQAVKIPEYLESSWEVVTALRVPAEEVEQIILQVADSIEKMEVNEAEQAYKILDEIVHKIGEAQEPMQGDPENPEVAIEAEDVEEELKELFIQLFDHVEIEYSPELIESCVKLALRGDISELIEKIDQEDEESGAAQDRGTHEVIKQLLSAISGIKKSVLHAYQIGKSALQLYSQQLVLDSI